MRLKKKKTALITGLSGQDGSYLADFLLRKNYIVVGTNRRSARFTNWRLKRLGIDNKVIYEEMELSEIYEIQRIFKKYNFDEVYNLAAQSFVGTSFNSPLNTVNITGLGTLRILETIKSVNPKIKFYQASSSEMFGGGSKKKLNEDSSFEPKSPYAASKVFAHNITKLYRESYDLFCANGILFNHESPFRGETFVTRKITRAVGRIHLGIQNKLTLGNLEASRDWGFAEDYVYGMWLMMQNDTAEDWVLATGETYTVKDFLHEAFSNIDLNWEDYVLTSEKYYRPNEVDFLLGDSSKAKNNLGWENKTSFKDLVTKMVESDIDLATQEQVLLENKLISPTWEYPSSNS